MSHPYTTILTDYLSEVSLERLAELRTAKVQRIMLIVIIILSLIVSFSLYVNYFRHSKLKQIEIESLLTDIASMKDKMGEDNITADVFRDTVSLENDLDHSKTIGSNIETSFIKFIDQLYVIDSQSPKSEEGNRFLRKTFNIALDRLKDQSMLDEIERFVNQSNDNIISKLKCQVVNITKKQSDYFMLKIAGFSNTSICSILSINTINALHQLKSRLKNNIINSDAEDKICFLRVLEVKHSSKL